MNSLQEFKDFTLVDRDGTLLADSRQIAEALKVEHESFIRLVRTYQIDIENYMGAIRFEIGSRNDGNIGGKQPTYALLTEDQSIYTGTLCRNTATVIQFKAKLVSAFQNARRQAQELSKAMLPSDPHDQVLMLCEKLTAMTIEAKQLTQKLVEQQPKVDAWGEFLDCDGLIDLGYVAQVCKTGKNRLFEVLRNAGVFFYQGKFNAIKQEYKERGYFDVKFKPNKKLGNIPTIKCTPKGAEWIYNKFYRRVTA